MMNIKDLKLSYSGSVKDIYEIEEDLLFNFSDRYSIFDWGQMPDTINEKGRALATTGRLLLENISTPLFWKNWQIPSYLKEEEKYKIENSEIYKNISSHGIHTNFISQLDDNLNKNPDGRNLRVKKFQVLRPNKNNYEYDYSVYKENPTNTLIPLEIIFRLGLPSGSSLLTRAKKNPEYLKSLGIENFPNEGDFFDHPIIEFSTKLEPSDRYLKYEDARGISNLSIEEFENLMMTTKILALRLHVLFKELGMELWDGKFEFAWDKERNLVLVDSIGLDELRVLFNGHHLSKEFLRQYYVKTPWVTKLSEYKSNLKNNWKEIMIQEGVIPEKLSPQYYDLTKNLYHSFTNELANYFGEKSPFTNASDLKDWEMEVNKLNKKEKLNVLIIGGGGREHALSWKITTSHSCHKVWVSPGNPAMKGEKIIPLGDILPDDEKLLTFIKSNLIDLVVIGPETPLVEGMADFLRKNNINVFGPSKEGALLEASKNFSKIIMKKAGIPTADYKEFTDPEKAFMFVSRTNWKDGIVVKIDGLAAGKGVVVCNDKDQARKAIKELMIDNILNLQDTKVIIEERLIGRELSSFALIDGEHFKVLGNACDYKRIRDYDEGPNTGGMGTYSPTDWISSEEEEQIKEQVIFPLIKTLRKEKIDYRGVIFVGLMKTASGMKVLEFNVRFGDPETQSLLPRIKSDFLGLLYATSTGNLSNCADIEFFDRSVVHIVAAAHGYPGTEGIAVRKGDEIFLSPKLNDLSPDDGIIFFAGVKEEDNKLVTNGGRVLGVSAFSKNREEARKKAYHLIREIKFKGMQYRDDIAKH